MNTTKVVRLVVLLVALNIYAVAKTVSGSVIDQSTQEPLPFAMIMEKGTTNAITTNLSGKFSLEITADSIEVMATGFAKQTLAANSNLVISLTPLAVSINSIVISNSRELEKKSEVPVAISTISSTAINDNKPTTIDEVLNQSSGVLMVNLGNEQHSMSIRQPMSYGAAYLYLEDGLPIRTSGVFNHNALLEMNMANVSSIEIIRGPASSLYGSEAVGGAVNFITKKASLQPTAGVSLQGNNLGYKRADFYASNTFNKLGIRVSGYYADRSNGFVEHTDFNKLALTLGASYELDDKTFVDFSSSYIDYYADMRGSLDSAKFYDKQYESNQTFTNRDVLAIRNKLQLNRFWNEASKTSLAIYQRQNSIKQNPSYRVKDDFKPWIGSGNPNLAHGEQNDNSFTSYGAVAQHKLKMLKNKLALIGGVSFDYSPNTYLANYISINKTDDGVYDSFTKTDSLLASYTTNLSNIAGYAQLSYSPIKGLNLVAAARYDHFIYDFKNDLDSNAFSGVSDNVTSFGKLTPKLGVTYNIGNTKGVYANYGQGYVPPQVSQLYRGVKVPNLGPAYYNNYEFGGWVSLLKGKLKLEVSLYQMDGLDEIISVRLDDNTIESRNAGKTQHMGVEYALNYEIIKGLLFRFNGTNATHKFVDYVEEGTSYNGKDMALAPRFYFNTQLTYKPTFFKGFRLSAEWQHVDKYFMENLNTRTYEGYDLFNVRVGYSWKMLEAWVNVINVTDALYARTASASKWGVSYSTGDPRNFNVGLAYKFSKTK